MSFYWLKRMYSLDTLDTRFTTSSSTPLEKTSTEHGVNEKKAPSAASTDVAASTIQGVPPSRWNTWEYYFYYLVFIIMVPLMFKVPYEVSKASDPQYPKFAPLLSAGWIPGRQVVSIRHHLVPRVSSSDPGRRITPTISMLHSGTIFRTWALY